MLDRIRMAITRFLVKYGTDWEKEQADMLAAVAAIRKDRDCMEETKVPAAVD